MEITTIPGYMPMRNDSRLQDVFRRNAGTVVGESGTLIMPAGRNRGGSTDMGDLSQLIPAIHPYTGGAVGPGHSKSYIVTDYDVAVINPAKIMAMSVIDLLYDGATQAKEVKSAHKAAMSRSAYLRFQREQAKSVRFDGAAV